MIINNHQWTLARIAGATSHEQLDEIACDMKQDKKDGCDYTLDKAGYALLEAAGKRRRAEIKNGEVTND